MGGAYSNFVRGHLMERDNLEDLSLDGRVILKLKFIFKNWDWEICTAVIWLRIGAGGGRLWMW
jgi:hypothetical protein